MREESGHEGVHQTRAWILFPGPLRDIVRFSSFLRPARAATMSKDQSRYIQRKNLIRYFALFLDSCIMERLPSSKCFPIKGRCIENSIRALRLSCL